MKKAGFNLVYDKSYPFGSQDLQPIVKEAQAASPDAFIAFSYPPDTLGLTDQARIAAFSPKVFFVGGGTAFPIFKGRFGPNAEGVMGIGGSNADLPGIKWYIRHHKEIIGREPDRWASPITYASLQVLQQAIERVGKIDREAVIKEINSASSTPSRKVMKTTSPRRSGRSGSGGQRFLRHRAMSAGRACADRAKTAWRSSLRRGMEWRRSPL